MLFLRFTIGTLLVVMCSALNAMHQPERLTWLALQKVATLEPLPATLPIPPLLQKVVRALRTCATQRKAELTTASRRLIRNDPLGWKLEMLRHERIPKVDVVFKACIDQRARIVKQFNKLRRMALVSAHSTTSVNNALVKTAEDTFGVEQALAFADHIITPEMLHFLLESGANPWAKGITLVHQDESAAQIAQRIHDTTVLKLLLHNSLIKPITH